MRLMVYNQPTLCREGIVSTLVFVLYYTVCYGLPDTLPAKVRFRNMKTDQFQNIPRELYVTIRTSHDIFKLRLIRSPTRRPDVPVFIPRKAGVIGDHKAVKTPVDVYQSLRKKAWFYIHPHTNTSKTRLTGIFSSKNYLYTVKTRMTVKGHNCVLLRQEMVLPRKNVRNTHTHSVIEELPSIYSPLLKLNKRQVILYEIELLVAVDYSVFRSWTENILEGDRGKGDVVDSVLDEIEAHYTLLVQGIKSRFETIKGYENYMVSVLPVGIYVANVSYASPWIFNTTYTRQDSERPILTSDAIALLANWVDVNKVQLPVFDHVMAFTANNLAHSENLNTLGVASQQSMCTERSLSIVEDHGNIAYASFVATHELAHSLGAKHDGVPPTVKYMDREETCSTEDGFIMSPKTSSRPRTDGGDRGWQFSPCSHLYFDFYIDHLNSKNDNCLLHSASHRNTGASGTLVPYSPDDQCARLHGTGSVMDRVVASQNTKTICSSIPCSSDDGETIETLAMEGTVCGVGMRCQRGDCVQDSHSTMEHTTDDCIFGDQPGLIADTHLTCTELVIDKPFNCYKYGRVCCTSCRRHLRHQTLLSDCSYGDRLPVCNWTMCDSAECCETCAVHNGVLVGCPDIPSQPFLLITQNTNSYHRGTVATFSCQSGYHLDGPGQIMCIGNGSWSDRIPICYRGCPKLADKIGEITVNLSTGNFSFGSLVHFRCSHGLVLVGDDSALCMNTSRWNTSLPSCMLEFSSPDTIVVPENPTAGTIVHRLSTGNGQATFEMVGMSHPGFIVYGTGVITVGASTLIDYEQVQIYRLHIQGILNRDPRFKASQVLHVLIKDINEFEPIFDQPTYSLSLPVDLPPDRRILQVHAQDTDLSTTNITYEISKSFTTSGAFQINSSSGEILLNSDTSFNSSAKTTLNLIVTAVDDGLPEAMTGSTTVVICVGFTCSGNASIPSAESTLFLVLVVHLRVLRI